MPVWVKTPEVGADEAIYIVGCAAKNQIQLVILPWVVAMIAWTGTPDVWAGAAVLVTIGFAIK